MRYSSKQSPSTSVASTSDIEDVSQLIVVALLIIGWVAFLAGRREMRRCLRHLPCTITKAAQTRSPARGRALLWI